MSDRRDQLVRRPRQVREVATAERNPPPGPGRASRHVVVIDQREAAMGAVPSAILLMVFGLFLLVLWMIVSGLLKATRQTLGYTSPRRVNNEGGRGRAHLR